MPRRYRRQPILNSLLILPLDRSSNKAVFGATRLLAARAVRIVPPLPTL
jgi:hypothetical protein